MNEHFTFSLIKIKPDFKNTGKCNHLVCANQTIILLPRNPDYLNINILGLCLDFFFYQIEINAYQHQSKFFESTKS